MGQNEPKNVDEGDSLCEYETPSEPQNRRQDSFSTRFRRRSQNIVAAITTIFLLILLVGTGLGIINEQTLNALKPLVEKLVENQQLLPDTPPATPATRKNAAKRNQKKVFDDHKTVGVFGGNLSSPTAMKLTRVLNEMHREGLVQSNESFTFVDVDGTGKTSSTKIKNTIRSVVLNGGAQTSEQESIVRELNKRGVRLTR